MLADFGEAHDSFLEFEIAPPVLDSIGSPPLDYHVDWIFLQRATEKRRSDVLLNHSQACRAIQQRFKEAQKLLVFVGVNRAVVVKDGEENIHHKLDRGALKDQEVVIFVEKDHLVQESFLFP